MRLSLKTIGYVARRSLDILWKLGLGAVGVAAILFAAFLTKEMSRSKYDGGTQISAYVKEYDKDGYVSLYNQREKKYTLERLDWVSHGIDESNIAVYCKNLKRGFFDYNTGKPLTEPVYDKAWNFYEDIGVVEKDGFITFLKPDFTPAFPDRFNVVRASDEWPEAIRFRHGQCVLAFTPDSVGVLDKRGNWVVAPEYQYVSELSADSCRVVKKDGLAGVVNYNGEIVLEPCYDSVSLPDKGIANVAKDGYQKQITFGGIVLRKFVFDDICDFDYPENKDFTLFKVGDKWGVMRSKDGKNVIPALYTNIKPLSGNRFMGLLPESADVSSNPMSRSSSWIMLDENNNVLPR